MEDRRLVLADWDGFGRGTGEAAPVRCTGKGGSIMDCCIPLNLPPWMEDRRWALADWDGFGRGTGEAALVAVKDDLLLICGILYCIVLVY